jgi:hypothetical protein
VTLAWTRRIVWQRIADRYQPRTAFLKDGSQLDFRLVRFEPGAVRLLRGDGVREVPLEQLAELHLAAIDPWDAYFGQLAGLGLGPQTRIARIETASGLRATGTTDRFQAATQGPVDKPESWRHLVQPAWSLDPLWVSHASVRVREYFLPHEVPLSRIEPAAHRQRSDLGVFWPWKADRNANGHVLNSAGTKRAWGLGVHATCELEFSLPAAARSFRTRLGLDQSVREGGCVQASVSWKPEGKGVNGQAVEPKQLYQSPVIVGCSREFDSGVLPLEMSSPGRLVLQVDSAHETRPPGADPLDIRDTFDWLEPLVELDPQQLRVETARRGPQQIPAWEGWQVAADGGVPLISRWDESDPAQRAYRLYVALGQATVRLSAPLQVRPGKDRLLLAIARPNGSTPSALEIRVDGQAAARFDVPQRPYQTVRPLVVSLAPYRGRTVNVEILVRSDDDRSLIEWRAITLTGDPGA